MEVASLAVLGAAEVVVAGTVVQALGLTATATDLVAVGVGGAATGLAWLTGHEWAISRDPQAAAEGRRGWLRAALGTAGVFLAANLGVRVYYGALSEQASNLGSGLVAPLLSGLLLTTVTAALMVVAAFVSAHAETAKESELGQSSGACGPSCAHWSVSGRGVLGQSPAARARSRRRKPRPQPDQSRSTVCAASLIIDDSGDVAPASGKAGATSWAR